MRILYRKLLDILLYNEYRQTFTGLMIRYNKLKCDALDFAETVSDFATLELNEKIFETYGENGEFNSVIFDSALYESEKFAKMAQYILTPAKYRV